MYYPQQSPGIAHKLPNHHDQSTWPRPHHPVLGPPGSQPNVGPPPPSPGYAIYTNGNVNPMHHPHHPHPMPLQHHHHQQSLSHYPSPPNGHSLQQHLTQGSPASVGSQIISPHWQQQLLKCEMIRSSRSPHHRARASAMASRTVTKSAIPITNPNLVKLPPPEINGSTKDDSSDVSESSPVSGHPSSALAPIVEAPRPTAIKPPKNTWNSLDMGGVGIKNIPATSGLFSFKFLINLYLNHNALSSIPPEISKLRHLEVLDLSGNNLTSLVPELGMLTQLKEFYIFDNHITTIPPELGSLYQLQTLGVEGNPLDASLKAIVQKDGTPALISYLRDSCPVPTPPPQRIWKNLLSPAEQDALESDPYAETFSVLCYNILGEKYATERLYGYTPAWALSWDYRKELILTEVMNYDADFLCLQEVDIGNYEDYFLHHLKGQDYAGVYWPKSRYKTMNQADQRQVDGCATFYKASKYQLVEKQLIEFSAVAMQRQDFKKTDDMFNRVLGKDHIAVVCLMENRHTGTRFIVVNAHIHWDPAYRDVKLVQVALLIEEIEKIANNFAKYPPPPPPTPESARASATDDGGPDSGSNAAGEPSASASASTSNQPPPRPPPVYSDGTKIPLVVCGDLNSIPDSGVYEFLSTGSLPANHPDFLSHTYGRYTSEGLRHRLGLKSAYAAPGAGELPLTNYVPTFQGVIDYVWYSGANLGVNAVLGGVDKAYLEKVVGFPNAHFPSDHVCIIAEFRVKPPRENPPRPPPPVFS
ncbi:Glucose-repressible alcohol dehydrogenase transcriptional effector [Hypsizygus marmoreus]|uniref:CCR4-Not complex 3'-5'-exoribonuclease subunit Ccr4 n=1 Tax=Hypsizygus marmoreus TaxID=39966 RepID=A0A369JB91_HYPMA|nr:Glucose-repressible alcohol dehydrogenase transcriptional effector [Hypsizygus marmoreus]